MDVLGWGDGRQSWTGIRRSSKKDQGQKDEGQPFSQGGWPLPFYSHRTWDSLKELRIEQFCVCSGKGQETSLTA
jgi:hypothetical protein